MPALSLRDLLASVVDMIEPSYYRLGAYLVMSMLDDPAMLAVAFC